MDTYKEKRAELFEDKQEPKVPRSIFTQTLWGLVAAVYIIVLMGVVILIAVATGKL